MNRTICALTVAILCLPPSLARASLTCSARKVELHDAFEGQQLLVSDAGRDVTREVTYRSADPKTAADARRYKRLTFDEAIVKNLKVMDATALTLCRDQKLPIAVFSIFKPGALKRVILGEDEGTLVHN